MIKQENFEKLLKAIDNIDEPKYPKTHNSNREKYEKLLKAIFQDKFDWNMFNFQDDEDIAFKMNLYLSNLTERNRCCIEAYYIHELTQSYIADNILGITTPATSSLIKRSIIKLNDPMLYYIICSKEYSIINFNDLDNYTISILHNAGVNNLQKMNKIMPLLSDDTRQCVINSLNVKYTPYGENDIRHLKLSRKIQDELLVCNINTIPELIKMCFEGKLRSNKITSVRDCHEIVDKISFYLKMKNNV